MPENEIRTYVQKTAVVSYKKMIRAMLARSNCVPSRDALPEAKCAQHKYNSEKKSAKDMHQKTTGNISS